MDADRILAEIGAMLAEVVGDELPLLGEITAATSFNDDLALESIEFVALAERIRDRYGARVDLVAFVADLEIDQIMGMTVGDLAGFIAHCLTGAEAGHA